MFHTTLALPNQRTFLVAYNDESFILSKVLIYPVSKWQKTKHIESLNEHTTTHIEMNEWSEDVREHLSSQIATAS